MARIHAARISTVPVIDDRGAVVGIVSAGDLLAMNCRQARRPVLRVRRREPAGASAEDVAMPMTTPAVTIRSYAAAGEAGRLMCQHHALSLPVVDSAGG
jgi:CBS-domain-containing membrane protein